MALSAATVERVKRTKFGRYAALSRLEEKVGSWNEVPFTLYRLNSNLFDALDFENNGVETKEDLSKLFNERVDPLLDCLAELQVYLTELKTTLA